MWPLAGPWFEENVEKQDVHDDRAEQRQPQGNVASNQAQQTNRNL